MQKADVVGAHSNARFARSDDYIGDLTQAPRTKHIGSAKNLWRVRPISLFFLSFTCVFGIGANAQTDDQQSKPTTAADSSSSVDPEDALVRTFFRDEFRIWTSPFRKRSYESHAFPKYVVPFALITGALIATDHLSSNILPNTPDQDLWSRRVSQVGSVYTLAGVTAATYLAGRFTDNARARETGVLGAEALAHTLIVTEVLKLATQRERPFDFRNNHSGGLGFGQGGDSFPSGHASSSFALAAVFAYEYGRDHRWVPYASYGLASVVAASRISAEKHWLSDIFVGGTTGFLIGRFVYKSHHNARLDGTTLRTSDRLFPDFGITSRGATASWSW